MRFTGRWFSMLGMALVAWPAMASAAGGVAPATSAWRCGAEGRVYADTPCADGRQLELPAPRPAADVRAAERLAQREAALGERLRSEREAREAAAIAASAQPVSLGPVRSAKAGVGAQRPARQARLEGAGPVADPRLPVPATKPKLKKPQRPSTLVSDRDADERTWRAVAPASRRTPG
jgi:hypothetical protein